MKSKIIKLLNRNDVAIVLGLVVAVACIALIICGYVLAAKFFAFMWQVL